MFANNLAWLLAAGEKPDLPRALTIINQVLERWPGEPLYRETRGEILVKLQRWKDALPDLQGATVVKPDDAKLHKMLAETYEHLDAPGLAAEHRRRAMAGTRAPGPATVTKPEPAQGP
jgi:predicted Zn-dependent protease